MAKTVGVIAALSTLTLTAQAMAQDAGSLTSRWREAFVSGDLQITLAMYQQDATFIGLRSREVGRDREAVRTYFAAVFEATANRTVTCDTPVVRLRGDVAVVAGVCQFDIAFKNGQKINTPMRYHMVAQKVGGTWSISDHHLSLLPAQ
jgi:uncharacterized protein (TIGR02246 family)